MLWEEIPSISPVKPRPSSVVALIFILLISIFLGSLGIDRFMLGDTGMGILKLLTAGLCGVLTIIDWFTISNKAKECNFAKFMELA